MTQTSSPSAPSRAHARLQMSTTASSPMVDMTHSPCQRLVSTRVSTSGAPTTSTTQSSQGGGNQPYYYDQLIAPTSGVTGLYKSWKVSGSKIELEFCAAGSNTVPVYVWLLPVSSDNASLPTNPPTSTSILAQSASPSLPAVDLRQRRR